MNNYLFFVKGRGNVGTLQNIVVICIWITIISLLLSVLSFIFDNRICNLIGNYFMGIFCSSIVALITTIIQFCRERNHRWKEFNRNFGSLYEVLRLKYYANVNNIAIKSKEMWFNY